MEEARRDLRKGEEACVGRTSHQGQSDSSMREVRGRARTQAMLASVLREQLRNEGG